MTNEREFADLERDQYKRHESGVWVLWDMDDSTPPDMDAGSMRTYLTLINYKRCLDCGVQTEHWWHGKKL